MAASILDGKALAEIKRHEVKQNVEALLQSGQRAPGLAVVLVGDDPASEIYVTNKQKACKSSGIASYSHRLPKTVSEEALLDLIHRLNADEAIDGILVQLPLPPHIQTEHIIEAIHPSKDVDGFHPFNVGALALRTPKLRPCTPYGIIQLLDAYEIPIRGQHAVVVGASNIVGRPMSLELLTAGATITVCHRFTEQLKTHVQAAKLLIVATGQMDVVNAEWLLPHHILIDVGIHRLPNGRVRGDVDYDKASQIVEWVTPVPGGVGPMTVAALIQNTLMARLRH